MNAHDITSTYIQATEGYMYYNRLRSGPGMERETATAQQPEAFLRMHGLAGAAVRARTKIHSWIDRVEVSRTFLNRSLLRFDCY